MKELEISNGKARVFHSLSEILSGMPKRARNSLWRVGEFRDFAGDACFELAEEEGTSDLARAYKAQSRVSFKEIEAMAKECGQVIWASFFCYDKLDSWNPWMRISAIDSSIWTVETIDEQALAHVRNTFEFVKDGWHSDY